MKITIKRKQNKTCAKRVLFTLFIAGLLAPTGLMAQKVLNVGGKIILDMSATGVGVGMNTGSVTNVGKTFNNYSPSATVHLVDQAYATAQNEKVFQKLEIAPQDLNALGQLAATGANMVWVDAFTFCKNLNSNGTGWRLPVHRELLMMWIFRTAIESFGSSFSSTYYWSATEPATATIVIGTSFDDGLTTSTNVNKINNFRARCVREVTP